ncbi:group II intron maturase-specific domain-containing protein [Candidatus Odyssella thessalonicensis]|uniref:group II intron maturase-specific domain-containing protein n=1 Tax=Candidatus Odyssella thessalonicensis TaxID=84647 RepID=UPI0002D2E7E8|nr:group II intron maturase-specific domain-containing protein [Candidatus Odyssella thessalonicensis]
MEKGILQKWLKAGFIQGRTLFRTEAGTPQGGIISPTLANLTLDGLETGLKAKFHRRNGRELSPRVNVIRYADDFIVTCRTKELLEEKVLPWVTTFLKARGLELSAEKTKITPIEEGFNFLGQNIRKYNEKLLIKPSKEGIKGFLNKIREVIKAHKQATAGELTNYLNPLIRGWANYHRHVVSAKTFSKVDAAIFRCIWKWCLRRHPNKGRRWIKRKYFDRIGNRNWVFYGMSTNKREGKVKHWLCYAAKTPIKRHIKIKAQANFYDKKWKTYFSQRLAKNQIQRPKLIQIVKPRS